VTNYRGVAGNELLSGCAVTRRHLEGALVEGNPRWEMKISDLLFKFLRAKYGRKFKVFSPTGAAG
jgi:hypothetical protein